MLEAVELACAILALGIALWSLIVAKKSSLASLYELRFAFYRKLDDVLVTVFGTGRFTRAQCIAIGDFWKESKLLFGPQVAKELQALYGAACDFDMIECHLETVRDPKKREAELVRQQASMQSAKRFRNNLESLFPFYIRAHMKGAPMLLEAFKLLQHRRLAAGDF